MKGKHGSVADAVRRLAAGMATAALCLMLGGCWDYRGLDELTIVAGFAIDGTESGGFLLSLEIIDTTATQEQVASSKLVQMEGRTIAEAVYNVNKKFYNNVYFGNADVAIISRQLAEQEDLNSLIDPLLRDNSIRDNLVILVSKEETAAELIEPEEDKKTIVSFDINSNLLNNRRTASSTMARELYEIYGILSRSRSDLALPAIGFASKEDKELILDGMAVFRREHLDGFLEETDMPLYLLTVTPLQGGGFVYSANGGKDKTMDVSMSIRRSAPRLQYTYENGRFTFRVDIEMLIAAVEFPGALHSQEGNIDDNLRTLRDESGKQLAGEIRAMIERYIREGRPDIFGFADAVYNQDPKLWRRVEKEWPALLKEASVDAACKVTINDTGLIKRY